MKLKITSAVAVLATFLLTAGAQAAAITGGITLSADASSIAIDFTNNTVKFTPASPSTNSKVDTVSGNLASLTSVGNSVSYKDFTYSPFSPVNQIWLTTSGLSFDLTSITSFTEIPGNSGLVLFGTGVLKTTVSGYDPTPGQWSFNSSNTGGVFSWGSTAAANVPDGGATLALLGVSMLGLGGARRFLTSKK